LQSGPRFVWHITYLEMKKKIIGWSNITTVVLLVFVAAIFISPQAKAFLVKGLMKVGFFQPPVKDEQAGTGEFAYIPDLTLKSADGTLVNLKEQKGKVVFVNFWAPWCPPCIAEMPSINTLFKQFKNNPNVLILTVDVDGKFSKSVPFMNKNGYQLPVYSFAGPIPDGFLTGSIPTTFVVDKTGKIVIRHEGAADYSNQKFINYFLELSKR
jgi:thiol-disulfide isomerase/thioredoxin